MSTTDSPPADTGPRVSAREARDLGGLRRTTKASPEGRHLGGVAGGLARHFDIDPVVVRVVLVVLVFFGGAGLLLYGAGWLFVPEEGSGHATVQLEERSRSLVLYVAAALAALAVLGDTVGRFEFPWPLAIVALVLLVALTRWPRRRGWTAEDRAALDARVAEATARADEAGDRVRAQVQAEVAAELARVDARVAAQTARYHARRRGPVLFWFTLALIALLEGVLGVVDAAGAPVAGPAYAALAVGVTGAMLVLGAFWGRAGGLVLVGLVAAAALGVSTAADQWGVGRDFHDTVVTPADAAAVDPDYTFGSGDLQLDLTRLGDPQALAGRAIHLDGRAGRILVRVPAGLAVEATGHISGPGYLQVLDEEGGGFSQTVSASSAGSAGSGQPLIIHAELRAGSIEIDRE